MRAASIKDVAAHADVSVGTVSNVLNRPHLVSEATRARVHGAIEALGFVRNEPARQLRAGSSRAIAYLMLDASNPFFTDVARGVEEVARSAGMAVYLCSSDQDPRREADYYDLLLEQRVRGVLITPLDAGSRQLRSLPAKGVPVVLVDNRIADDSLCSVGVDDVMGGRLAAGHLVEQGHERIAVIGGRPVLPQVRDRIEGARAAVHAAGLRGSALTVLGTDGLDVAEGRAAGQRLAGLPKATRPTAAFCLNDLIALGLLQEMTRFGVRVPGDLSIVGYDDIEFAGAAAVPLTSVRQPRRELGRTAAALLLAEAASDPDHEHQRIQFRPELVVRASSTRPGAR